MDDTQALTKTPQKSSKKLQDKNKTSPTTLTVQHLLDICERAKVKPKDMPLLTHDENTLSSAFGQQTWTEDGETVRLYLKVDKTKDKQEV